MDGMFSLFWIFFAIVFLLIIGTFLTVLVKG